MNFRHLKYFIATAETGQVSRAANVLSISQSSVTTAIKDLEKTLGAALFQRSSHGMDLTQAGRQFLAASKEILEKVEAATKIIPNKTDVRGTISVAATYTVMGYFLPYHLDRLSQLHPNLNIQLHETNRESIEDGLISGRFDIAVLLTSNLHNSELDSETLLRSPRRLWVANGHKLARSGKVTFEEIANEDYIMLTLDEAAQTTMKYWSQTTFSPKTKLRTSSVEAVRSMVANGQGISILSDMVYRPWSLEGKRIDVLPTDIIPPTMDVGLAWTRNAEFTEPMNLLFDYFQLNKFRLM